jgi:hypothetical protein
VEIEAIGERVGSREGRQQVDDWFFSAPVPEVVDFFAEFFAKWRVVWPVEAGGESMMKLKWLWLSVTFSGQVENTLDLGDSGGTLSVFVPVGNLLATSRS